MLRSIFHIIALISCIIFICFVFLDDRILGKFSRFLSVRLRCKNCSVNAIFSMHSLSQLKDVSINNGLFVSTTNNFTDIYFSKFPTEMITGKNGFSTAMTTDAIFANSEKGTQDRPLRILSSILAVTPAVASREIIFPTTPKSAGAPFDQIDKNSSISVKILHRPPKICEPEKTFVVVIISEPQDFEQRQIIRETWAMDKSNKSSVIFHVGQLRDEVKQKEIEPRLLQEIANFSDIFISDIIENYYNLTLKTYGALIFLSENCQQASCAMKSDADTVLNLRALEKLCKESQPMTFRGACWKGGPPDRNFQSKWYVPHWVWHDNYPNFCSGSAYMIVGKDAPTKLLRAADETRFHSSSNFRKLGEDVVWTGFAAQKANITGIFTSGFSPDNKLQYYCFSDTRKSVALSAHYLKGRSIISHYWQNMKYERSC